MFSLKRDSLFLTKKLLLTSIILFAIVTALLFAGYYFSSQEPIENENTDIYIKNLEMSIQANMEKKQFVIITSFQFIRHKFSEKSILLFFPKYKLINTLIPPSFGILLSPIKYNCNINILAGNILLRNSSFSQVKNDFLNISLVDMDFHQLTFKIYYTLENISDLVLFWKYIELQFFAPGKLSVFNFRISLKILKDSESPFKQINSYLRVQPNIERRLKAIDNGNSTVLSADVKFIPKDSLISHTVLATKNSLYALVYNYYIGTLFGKILIIGSAFIVKLIILFTVIVILDKVENAKVFEINLSDWVFFLIYNICISFIPIHISNPQRSFVLDFENLFTIVNLITAVAIFYLMIIFFLWPIFLFAKAIMKLRNEFVIGFDVFGFRFWMKNSKMLKITVVVYLTLTYFVIYTFLSRFIEYFAVYYYPLYFLFLVGIAWVLCIVIIIRIVIQIIIYENDLYVKFKSVYWTLSAAQSGSSMIITPDIQSIMWEFRKYIKEEDIPLVENILKVWSKRGIIKKFDDDRILKTENDYRPETPSFLRERKDVLKKLETFHNRKDEIIKEIKKVFRKSLL